MAGLKLARDQLAQFLKSHEQIRQFENLFSAVDKIAPDVVNEVDALAGNALDVGNKAVSLARSLSELLYPVTSSNLVFVAEKSDLPTPVAGVITLLANTMYMFVAPVDLTGDRLVASANTAISGTSSETASIISTGLIGTALLSSAFTLPINDISITADVALNLVAVTPLQALDWFSVNFVDCPVIGIISGYNNFVVSSMGILSSANLTIDGTIGTVAVNGSILNGIAGQRTLIVAATAVITRRFRVIYSALSAPAAATSIDVSVSATIPAEAYILDTCNFSGAGAAQSGVTYLDAKSLFVNNVGITNTAAISAYSMIANATATVIAAANTPVKVLGTTIANALNQKFTHSNNRLTYTGSISKDFKILAVATFTSAANNQIGFYIAKNGAVIAVSSSIATADAAGRKENVTIMAMLQMVTGDYVELWVENQTLANNVTVVNSNFITTGAS